MYALNTDSGVGGSSTTNNQSARVEEPAMLPIKLMTSFAGQSPVEALQRTLEYATSPRNYLLRTLGPEVFESRKHMLSLPEEPVDRDIYGVGKHKQHFEQHIATFLGKKHGYFFPTGIQAQLCACKVHCDAAKNNRVAWHSRSHLEIHEENSYDTLFHFERTIIGKSQLQLPTVADVEAVTSLPEDKRPAVIVLELPNRELGCATYTYDDLMQISKLCKAANVKLHMDGARLWEIEPYYKRTNDKSFAEISALFDSVYVSFYKGLKGACGAVLTSDDETVIATTKVWQRRLGGNTVASYHDVLDCERGFNSNIGTFDVKRQKMLSVAKSILDATAPYKTKDGKSMVYFNTTEPTCCQVHTHVLGATAEQAIAARDAVEREVGIRVFNSLRPWQNYDEQQNASLVQRGDEPPTEGAPPVKENPKEGMEADHQWCEWMIMDDNLNIPDAVFAKGWKALCEKLSKH